jgi:hypothetical protein
MAAGVQVIGPSNYLLADNFTYSLFFSTVFLQDPAYITILRILFRAKRNGIFEPVITVRSFYSQDIPKVQQVSGYEHCMVFRIFCASGVLCIRISCASGFLVL